MGKIRILVVVAACAVLSNLSFGMYNPEMGRFMQRDPIGTAVDATHTKQGSLVVSARATIQPNTASASSPSTLTKEHTSGLNFKSQQLRKQQLIGLNVYDQYKDGMNLYQYVSSNPGNHIDPYGLAKTATICIRPLNSWPYTWHTVHCFIKGESGNWNFGKDEGFAEEPNPDGVNGKTPKCVKVNCKCDIDQVIAKNKWEKERYHFTKQNCCHWVDMVLKKAQCNGGKGIDSLFPRYKLPTPKPAY